MKFTRDGAIWTILFLTGLIGFLVANFGLLSTSFGVGPMWKERLEFAFALLGFLGGFLKLSPLPLSSDNSMASSQSGRAINPLNQPKSLLLPFLLIASFSSMGCAHRPDTIVTPQGKTAYAADQIVLRVNELQKAAIEAEAGKALSLAAARELVQFTVTADKILKATPVGWQAAVSAAWSATRQRAGAPTNPAILAAMNAVDVVLAAYGGGQ